MAEGKIEGKPCLFCIWAEQLDNLEKSQISDSELEKEEWYGCRYIGRSTNFFDVFTRIPANGFTVHSFLKKIEWAQIKKRPVGGEEILEKNYPLRDKTFGMIIFKNATPKAIKIANSKGINFLRLNDIKINIREIREKVELQYLDQ